MQTKRSAPVIPHEDVSVGQVCVAARDSGLVDPNLKLPRCVYVCVNVSSCIYVCVCVCLCVRARERARAYVRVRARVRVRAKKMMSDTTLG